MNSTKEDVHINLLLQDEASSSGNKQLSSPDNNANLNATASKGAIPKTNSMTKFTASSKKSVKINNNIEEVNLQKSHVHPSELKEKHQQNGFVDCLPSQVPQSYLTDIKDPYTNKKYWNCEKLENKDTFLTLNDLKTFNVPSVSQCDLLKDSFSDFSFYRKECRLSESSSEGNELLSISDDGCIYTYKGDQVADLPSSFFSLEVPLQPSPEILVQNRQANNASPEMDYLEMDFDPGPSGDADSDSGSNNDLESAQNERYCEESNQNSLCKVETVNTQKSAETEIVSSEIVKNNIKAESKEISAEERPIPKDQTLEASVESKPPVQDQNAILTARIRALKLPWLFSPNRTSINPLNRTSVKQTTTEKSLGNKMPSSSDFGDICSSSCDKSTTKQSTSKSCNSSPSDQISKARMREVMIWSEEEAYRKQISQIGVSACGATAVLNVLKALRFPIPSAEKIQTLVKTRLRENSSPLPEYLLSRSVAGCTHDDIIVGLSKASDGQIYSRFFHMFPERDFDFACFLRFWIKNGAVPIVSLNLQKCRGNNSIIADAWHHQMVYGIGPKGIYLTNPLECVDLSQIWPQLCSESVLLIKREDVLSRWNQKTDLPRLMKINKPGWGKINVVGQVANMVRESKREFRQGFTNTSHIKIPAAYSSGVTIALKKNNPVYPLLRFCAELPVLDPEKIKSSLEKSLHIS